MEVRDTKLRDFAIFLDFVISINNEKIMVSLELYWMWSHSLHHDEHIKPKPMGESRNSLNQIWVTSTSRLHEKNYF